MNRTRSIAILVAFAACKKTEDPVVARLVEMTAQVERMPRDAAPWGPAAVGNTFIIGSGVRTAAGARAKLRVGAKGTLEVQPSSVVYFRRTPGRERDDLHVETGAVELETGDATVGIGDAVLDPNTHAHIEASANSTSLVVTVGRAVLEDSVIGAGQKVALDPAGHAVRETVAHMPADAGMAAPANGSTIVAVRDNPVRVRTANGEAELAVGEHPIESGTVVTIPAGATLEIERGGARAIASGPSEITIGTGATLVALSRGSATLHAERIAAVAIVPGGTITALLGTEAALAVSPEGTAVDAEQGDVAIATAHGTTTLSGGQSAMLRGTGEVEQLPPPPARTVASIVAGEAAVIHDMAAPTPVHVAFGDACPHTGIVEVARDRSFKKVVARAGGVGGANVLFPVGMMSYRVRCDGGRGATGTVRVAKDSGRTPLPKVAARTSVDMDGREYTILYQNLLPELTLTWRTAPRGTSKYTFVIKPERGAEKRVPSSTSTLKLASGDMREGSYKVFVEPDGGSRSETSRIVIDFDNAAQSASIDGVDASGGTVHVRGTVIEGSTVSANGAAVELDRHRRFTTELTAGAGEDGTSIRIAHPKAGIHYYVMRTGPT